MTRTSRMDAITTPARWGYEVVDVFFGEVRVRKNQTIAFKGDLLRKDGIVREFIAREGTELVLADAVNLN